MGKLITRKGKREEGSRDGRRNGSRLLKINARDGSRRF